MIGLLFLGELFGPGEATAFFPAFWYTEERLDLVIAGDIDVVDFSTAILLALDIGALNSTS